MSDPKLNGGVVLGGQEFRITLSRADAHNLKELAKIYGVTPTYMATDLLTANLRYWVLQVQIGTAVSSAMARMFGVFG